MAPTVPSGARQARYLPIVLAADAFRSLRRHNYQLWASGALISNIGTWVQRTAQDWLVLTVLTHRSAGAVGVVMALQFAPQLLFLPWTGAAADGLDLRRLLIATQTIMGVLALVLGSLTVSGAVQLWHVYGFAFLFGTAAAFDAPARQIFVSQIAGDADLHNAVTLNTMSFNISNLIGPAISGLLIASVGIGWAFMVNGMSFFAALVPLTLLRNGELYPSERSARSSGSFTEGLRYVARRNDLLAILLMLFLIGAFGQNFPIFISTMAVRLLHSDARGFATLSSVMAVGTIAGTLLSARNGRPKLRTLLWSSWWLGIGLIAGGLAPTYRTFAAALVVVGVSYITFINATNPLMQLSTAPAMRGRVMALRVAAAFGATPIGAPAVGWVADHFGPRWALSVGAASGFAAAAVAGYAILRAEGHPAERFGAD